MNAKTYRNGSALEEVERAVRDAAKSDKTKVIVVRLTPKEHKALRIKAAHGETTVVAMMRDLVTALLSEEK